MGSPTRSLSLEFLPSASLRCHSNSQPWLDQPMAAGYGDVMAWSCSSLAPLSSSSRPGCGWEMRWGGKSARGALGPLCFSRPIRPSTPCLALPLPTLPLSLPCARISALSLRVVLVSGCLGPSVCLSPLELGGSFFTLYLCPRVPDSECISLSPGISASPAVSPSGLAGGCLLQTRAQ